MWYRTLLFTAGVAALFFASGCAKFPSNQGAGAGPQLQITMTVAGQINPAYYYFVVFDVSNDSAGQNGPVPVIAPPSANGFCAAEVAPSTTSTGNPGGTSYVEYFGNSQAANSGGYQLFAFQPNSNLQGSTPIGAPPQFSTPGQAGASPNTIQFTVYLSQLAAGTNISASNIQFLQVNAIVTDSLPIGSGSFQKTFDALNDSVNSPLSDYITIRTDVSQTYTVNCPGSAQLTNGNGGYTNTNNPDLQITNFNVTVIR